MYFSSRFFEIMELTVKKSKFHNSQKSYTFFLVILIVTYNTEAISNCKLFYNFHSALQINILLRIL